MVIVRKVGRYHKRMYDIHGMFRLQVQSPDEDALRHFDAEFGYFSTQDGGDPDLTVVIDGFRILPSAVSRRVGGYYIEKGLIAGRDRHKIARWRFALQNDEHTSSLYFKGGIFSLGFLQQRYLEQLMRYKMVFKELCLIHASCVARNGRAVLFPAPPNVGKTGLSLHLATQGWEFLSDDSTILTPQGQVFSVPRRLHLSAHKRDAYPALASVTWRDRLSLVALQAIRMLTLGYGSLTIPLPIKKLWPDVLHLDQARLEHVVFPVIHGGDGVEGPLPVPRDMALERLIAIDSMEMRHLWQLLRMHKAVDGSWCLSRWSEEAHHVLKSALARVSCHEILIPQRVDNFPQLWSDIGKRVGQLLPQSPVGAVIASSPLMAMGIAWLTGIAGLMGMA